MFIPKIILTIKKNFGIISIISISSSHILSKGQLNLDLTFLELAFLFFSLILFSNKSYQRNIRKARIYLINIKMEHTSTFLLIIIIIISLLLNINSSEIIKSYYSYAILKIKNGNNNIFNPQDLYNTNNIPNEVHIGS